MLQNGKHHFYWFTAILCALLFLTAKGFSQGNTPVTSPKRDSLHTTATSALAPAPTPATTPALTTTPPPPKPDTTHPAPLVYHYDSPTSDSHDCPLGVETSSECWRREKNLANMTTGYPGIRALTLSTTNWQPLPISSPYFPSWQHSQYLNNTLGPTEKYGLKISGSDIQGLEEIWMPVIPIDTPTTRLDWERGPFAMNIFNLKLRRMLSDYVYLGMDYYSATADSFTYDYQFNVHQPYLGGWGFLGQIYHPIDRDSASLVIEGLSHQIKSTAIRPRVGVWLDTNRVLEFYLNYLKNSTTLTYPQGPATFNSLARPGAVDSMQALMPARFVSATDGILYGEHHNRWSWQGEGSYTSLSKAEIRPSDSALGQAASPSQSAAPTSSPLASDQLSANIFKISTTFNGYKIPLKPTLTFLTQSETWSSDSVHTTLNPNKVGLTATTAWTDKEEFNLAIHPEFGNLNLSANAGLNRSSRMDDQVFFLERHGVSAQLQLPFHTRAEIGLAGQSQDPDWEILYRTNPARSLYASPSLQPRNDQTYQGSVDWSWSRFSLGAGVDFFRSTDAWLPRILPSPTVCQDLIDTLYSGVNSGVNTILCKAGADSTAYTLPDSLALALRNYDEEQLDGWHLTLGYGLGNWNLNLENHFLLNRTIKNGALKTDLEVWTVPARVFKGRLGWKRDLVDNKLHLDFAWEWEWFSTRYAWASDLRGNSKLEKLDEYLALDFKAAMRIKTFTLFFRSMNFNHDRYATEAGVHPPGVNFRFGVDWALAN